MPRPSRIHEQRRELLPVVADVFAELGYRGTTTRILAKRCGVEQMILYRLWDGKRAMFSAAIDFLFERRMGEVADVLKGRRSGKGVEDRLIDHFAGHMKAGGLYRLVFAALAEADNPGVRAAMERMYRNFQGFVEGHVRARRGRKPGRGAPPAQDTAWAIMGLATMLNILTHLNMTTSGERRRVFSRVVRYLLGGPRG